MNYTDEKVAGLDFNPFSKIGSEWALLSAVSGEERNAMTVSWGQVGVLWNKPIFTVYVRPTRHTYDLLEKTDVATLSFFGEDKKKMLTYLGRTSGRDEDKLKKAGLPFRTENGALLFDDATLTLVGKKLYHSDIDPRHFWDSTIDSNYSNDYHREYVFEITDVKKAP